MTTPVGSLPSSVPLPAHGAAHGATHSAKPAASPFGHQLQAARQQHGAGAQESTADHAPRSPRGHAPGRERHSGASSAEDGRSDRLQTRGMQTTRANDPLPADRAPAVPEAGLASSPAVAIMAGVATGEPAPGEAAADDSELAASALVGAMFAMLDPVAGKVASPVTSAPPGAGLDPAASGLLVAMPDAGGDMAAMAMAKSLASAPMADSLFATDSLPLLGKGLRDAAGTDVAAALGMSPPLVTALPAPVVVAAAVPAGSHAFSQELGQQLAWFVSHDVKEARIRLHPEELGSLDLKISVNHGRVDVVFHAQHPGAVNAVQQSLPQLDHMLAQHGLSLGNTEVGQQDRGDQSGQSNQQAAALDATESPSAQPMTVLSSVALLDAFA